MLTEYEKLRLGRNFFAEVNWQPNDSKTNQCQVIKFTFPDGKQEYVEKSKLLAFLFIIGSRAEQRKMIPQKVRQVRWYETKLKIKAKKNIQKGEYIIASVKLSLPTLEEEIIGEMSKRYKVPRQMIEKRPSGILVPNLNN